MYNDLSPKSLKYIDKTDTYIKASFNSDKAGILFMPIPYDKGWKVKIDGRDRTSRELFGAFLAVDVPAGEHTVEFSFMPEGLLLGIIISLIAIATVCVIFLFPFFKGRKEKSIPKDINKESKVMKLWGGRFTKQTDKLVHEFNKSLAFDKRLFRHDIEGSMAHVKMLNKQGILTDMEKGKILEGLEQIEDDIIQGRLLFEEDAEDIHSFVEAHLIERIGDIGKKLHTARSRNDQVALDMKLYTRDEIDIIDELIGSLLKVILNIMKENIDTIMPGFTHLQKAQPTTLAHHMGAYFEMLYRDRDRLRDCRRRLNTCPLGAGAFAGTTYPLDREYSAKLLGFDTATGNSMDSVSDRDYIIELLSDLSMISMHLSRLSEEIIIWNTNEYRFIEIDDTYSTGSSIMPQKKNPDIAELIRGKTGRVYGSLMSILTTMKGLPLAYNKDMQEDKEFTFDAMDTVKMCLKLMEGMLLSMRFNKEVMNKSARGGFTNATDAADYLVNKGIPFRDAHGIIGSLVLYAIEKNKSLDELSIEEFKNISTNFDEDIYDAISMQSCVERRNTKGAPGFIAMENAIKEYEKLI